MMRNAGLAYFPKRSEARMNELLLDYLPLVVFVAVAAGIGVALLVVPFIIAFMIALFLITYIAPISTVLVSMFGVGSGS